MVTHDESTCPDCGGALKYYDSVPRVVRTKKRSTSWIKVRRLRCIKCGHLHRELQMIFFRTSSMRRKLSEA